MSKPEQHQRDLWVAMGVALAAPETPVFMDAEKEALALIGLCRKVESYVRSGYCPVTKLMVLSQQALRVAAVAWSQSESRTDVVDGLIARTVPGGSDGP